MDVRAFVNIPLRREGKWTANFWVGHHERRSWKNSEVELLRNIADRVALVIDQTRTASALSASEHRLAVALETGRLGAFDLATGTGIMTCTAQCKANFGRPPDAPFSFADVLAAIHPDHRESVQAALAACASDGRDFWGEHRCLWPDGSVHWIQARGRRIVAEDGFHAVGVTCDVTEAKEAAQRQRLMTNELNHRVKNTLAVIQSIAHQTGRHTPDPHEFFEAFSARLASLASVHDILTKAAWAGAPLDQLARVSLEPFRAEDAEAIEIKGAPVLLNSGSALALGLTLHELATNAAKYGALSAPAGRVLVSWSLDGPDSERLHFEWRESGGPRVDPPRRGGFGLRLIENVAAQLEADSTHEFLPEGVRYRFSMPLPRLAQAIPAAA
jgi:two-component sensor histidine kinase